MASGQDPKDFGVVSNPLEKVNQNIPQFLATQVLDKNGKIKVEAGRYKPDKDGKLERVQ